MVTVLLVCTANTGRSPLAAALLERRLADRGLTGQVQVSSAGLLESGQPVADSVATAARARGASLVGHRSTQLAVEHVAGAELILCMMDRHVEHVTDLAPRATGRVFLLGRFVRLLEQTGPRPSSQTLEEYLDRVVDGADCLESAPERDRAPDPYGGPPGALADTADRLDELTGRLADHLWPAGGGRAGV